MPIGGADALSAYCEALVRFIAAQMLDPHRYFEQKLLGQLAQCTDHAARSTLLRSLIQWLGDDGLLTHEQRGQLEQLLAAKGWPSTSLVEQDPELAITLLHGPRDDAGRSRLQWALDNSDLGDEDRAVVQDCLRSSSR